MDDVALVASSMGNSVMFRALGRLPTPPCTLVAISPVLVSSDSHGTVDGTSMVGLPDNVWVTWEEQNDELADNADLIQSRATELGVPSPRLPAGRHRRPQHRSGAKSRRGAGLRRRRDRLLLIATAELLSS